MKVIAQTDRILLREMTTIDAQSFYDLNEDPVVLQYTGDSAFTSINEAYTFIATYDQYHKYEMGRWAVINKKSEKYIGWCGLKYHEEEDFVDLGFRFFRNEWGKGYATEAAKSCLEYGFLHLNLDKIIGRADVRNHASIRVLEKIGMSKCGTFIEHGNEILVYEVMKEERE